jgi:LacI family transcriptional regulator
LFFRESALKDGGNMASTIYDVAHRAGVSISTVSRVLNNNPNVLEETRQRVLKTIAEMEFKPNQIARGLVVKQTNLIQVFFSWFGLHCDFQSHWYVQLLNGVNEVVQENQYGLLVNTIAGVFDPQAIHRKIFHNAFDGILLVSPYLEEKEILRIVEKRIPAVLIGRRTDDTQLDFVDSDNVNAASQVVDYLVGLGHKKIACIAGPAKLPGDAADRLSGFEQAMKKHGLPIPKSYVPQGEFTEDWGREAMKNLLGLADRPTAVFASDDAIALGAWASIEKSGLKVGKDISLVGFDDIPESSASPYSLTTMRQDFQKLGTEATRLLIEKIKNPEGWKPRHVFMPTPLIVRQSCGPGK